MYKQKEQKVDSIEVSGNINVNFVEAITLVKCGHLDNTKRKQLIILQIEFEWKVCIILSDVWPLVILFILPLNLLIHNI